MLRLIVVAVAPVLAVTLAVAASHQLVDEMLQRTVEEGAGGRSRASSTSPRPPASASPSPPPCIRRPARTLLGAALAILYPLLEILDALIEVLNLLRRQGPPHPLYDFVARMHAIGLFMLRNRHAALRAASLALLKPLDDVDPAKGVAAPKRMSHGHYACECATRPPPTQQNASTPCLQTKK